jgi:hypothetical protein
MRRAPLLLPWLVLACSGGSGNPDAGGPDANTTDAPPSADATVDATPPIDAYAPDLSCLGAGLPDSADDPVGISGDVFDPGIPGLIAASQLSGVELTSFAYGDETTPLATGVSAATTGAYALSAATGGNPLDAYIRAQQPLAGNNDHITSYVYPGVPQTTSQTGISIPMISESTFALLQNFTGLSQTADQGLVSVIVVDCRGNPIQGAIVSSTPAADTVAYVSGSSLNTSGPTDATGLAFLIDVPIADADTSTEIQVTASYDGMALRAHNVIVPEFLNTADDSPTSDDERRMVTTQVVP